MRVFKFLIKFIFIIYIFSIIADLWVDKYMAKKKFELLYKSNLVTEISKKRLILYGSSDCDYGLSAREISKVFDITTINLCNYGIFRKKYEKEFINNLVSNTRSNDVIIYVLRLNLEDVSLEEDGILGFLLPQIRLSIHTVYKWIFKKTKDFDEFGDRNYFPRKNVNFNFLKYKIDYEKINRDLTNSVHKILNHKKLKAKIIILTTPILIETKNNFNPEYIKFDCFGDNCNKLIHFSTPLLIEDKSYFSTIGPRHLNPEKGRAYWTSDLINLLNENYKNLF